MSDTTHQDLILDQFTRQATVFSTAPTITDEDALRMVVEAAGPASDDRLLDVACGPGLVVCAFAPHVQEATGIDVTPAMIERARKLAADKRLANVAWRVNWSRISSRWFVSVIFRAARSAAPAPCRSGRPVGHGPAPV